MTELPERFETVYKALDRTDLLAAPVAAALAGWSGPTASDSFFVVDSDPAVADTAAFCERYGAHMEESANCVVVRAKKGADYHLAACMTLAHRRLDVNGAVRRHLGARKASFAPMDVTVEETGMEYGGITPLGLPSSWPVLIDAAVVEVPYVLLGSGRRRGKLLAPGKALAELPGAQVVEGLAQDLAP
ncbi:prolyl-tRNA synthetase [Streptomyces sp. CB03234]|uniref:YbaK/EbsC family protein n=1 Tax=Streptomyces sp. (strain CB03234) TaxID=1703937 RepID=UPI0009396595|nr:YbaK/EbsC family protein [Streptomyces sp. CB03234]OKK04741.1 prolyl-tRNA synthetase [Streptomyces sp. CB03234]